MSDAVSREDVVEYLKSQLWIDGFVEVPADELIVAIRALPAVQPVTVRLVFCNADATPKTTVLDVSAEAVPDIMAWYGAYCSGDRYTVTVDGRNVPMDQNGEPAHVSETPKSEHDAAVMLTPATKGGAEPTDAQPDLTDPNVVHVNMLRGTIAKPTLEQIRHLYGDAVQIKMTMQDEAEAQFRWIAATKGGA